MCAVCSNNKLYLYFFSGAFNAHSRACKTETLFLSALLVDDDDDDRYHVHRKHAFKLSSAKGNERKRKKKERKEAKRKRALEKVSRFSRRAMVYFCAPSRT